MVRLRRSPESITSKCKSGCFALTLVSDANVNNYKRYSYVTTNYLWIFAEMCTDCPRVLVEVVVVSIEEVRITLTINNEARPSD